MKCFLIGSKELSVKVLEELVQQKHDVVGVLTRDHEESMKIWLEELGHRSLKKRADDLNIPVHEKKSVNSKEIIDLLMNLDLDILFSVFWGEIVKGEVLRIPKLGCFNLHTAYLPNNRGSFPMVWAIVNGEEHAGFTIHKMTKGVDDGPIVAQVKVPIETDDTGERLYNKVTEAGFHLFKETLPSFTNMTFTLQPQNLDQGSYHPRGYPYGGQINSYWEKGKIERFKKALHFPPFKGHLTEPSKYISNNTGPNVRIMLGFDCDRPRGEYIFTKEGSEMAERKINSIDNISKELEKIKVPRTFFICGEFLESMSSKFGAQTLKKAFQINNSLVEIADHSYSHNILKKIDARPDKTPIPPKQVIEEYRKNTDVFNEILKIDIPIRGYRAPLGHYNGVSGEYRLLDKLLREGVSYISSDLRDKNHSLHPKLIMPDGTPRQPYRYENGLLEIPSMGWQDTVFLGISKTPILEKVPQSYEEIIEYYTSLFLAAKEIAVKNNRDYFLGLVLHPYDNSFYNADGKFFVDLHDKIIELGGSFCTYKDVCDHYNMTFNNQINY